ncbi:MAG: TauD/TfdA family dioxygenase [Chromatiales bacterium]|jgi:taurine dioxygenase|nr:TauD/TfdA family dioxygenase [Chromatiales bacterium]
MSAQLQEFALNTVPLTSFMGARVDDIDLSQPLDDNVMEAIRQALAEHSLLLFPTQTNLTPKRQIEFSRCFGQLEEHVLSNFCLEGHPEIFVVSNIIENGQHIGAFGGSKAYHSDLAYIPEPSLGSVFRCLECPPEGGETAFISMFAVYDALDPGRQAWLRERTAVFDYVWFYERHHTDRPALSQAQKDRVPPLEQPCVRMHPVTGRPALYVSPTWVRRFGDMSEADSEPLLEELLAFACDDRFAYYHRWTPGDVLVWDNRSSMHKACPFDEEGSRRLMHRTTVKGDAPIMFRVTS